MYHARTRTTPGRSTEMTISSGDSRTSTPGSSTIGSASVTSQMRQCSDVCTNSSPGTPRSMSAASAVPPSSSATSGSATQRTALSWSHWRYCSAVIEGSYRMRLRSMSTCRSQPRAMGTYGATYATSQCPSVNGISTRPIGPPARVTKSTSGWWYSGLPAGSLMWPALATPGSTSQKLRGMAATRTSRGRRRQRAHIITGTTNNTTSRVMLPPSGFAITNNGNVTAAASTAERRSTRSLAGSTTATPTQQTSTPTKAAPGMETRRDRGTGPM